jgi:hypothetical protein
MILTVALADFPAAAKRYAAGQPAFLSPDKGRITCSCFGPESRILVTANATDEAKARAALTEAGIDVFMGSWSLDRALSGEKWICAVAYKAGDRKPGLWVDACPGPVSVAEVLTKLFDEFKAEGLLEEMGYEEFIQSAQPNVLILDPAEQGALPRD